MRRLPDQPRVLLIHGAWQGAWVWEALRPFLESAGFCVHAPNLPGNGSDEVSPLDVSLELYVDFLSHWLTQFDGRAGIVAHSGGGVIASQLAERWSDRIAGIIYLAGMMLPSGMGFSDLISELSLDDASAGGIGPHLVWSEEGRVSSVPPKAAQKIFLHDLSIEAAEKASLQLTPQGENGRALVARLTPQRFGAVPRLYVEAINDRSVVLAAQRLMQALSPGAEVVSLETGHAPHVSAPKATAEVIVPALRRWLSGATQDVRDEVVG